VRLLGWIFLFQLDFYFIRARQLLFSLNGLNSVFFKDVFLSEDDLPHVHNHPFLDLQVDLKFDILKFKDVIFDDDF
jgi:hypothetical protein